MIGRHYIYGIDYVSGPFSEVVDFIEEAHNDKSAVLIGFAPMTSAANAVRNKEYRNILNSFDIVSSVLLVLLSISYLEKLPGRPIHGKKLVSNGSGVLFMSQSKLADMSAAD